MSQFNFEAIGTKWQIDIFKELTEAEEISLLSNIKNRIDIFDQTYSRFRSDSLVTEISKSAGTFVLPDDAKPMMEMYRDMYLRTNGLVTPLVGNLISDAGYDASYSLTQNNELQPSPKWEDAIEYHYPNLIVKNPVLLDFGAAGKGYLIDIVGKVLEENNIMQYSIDASGDILHKSEDPIKVGLENPEDTKQVIGVYELQDGSICGSAGNRRVWGDFTHIINPKTLSSPKDILAVWVAAETAMEADALATCLFFVKEEAMSGYKFEYLILRSDHSIEKSVNFKGEIFTK